MKCKTNASSLAIAHSATYNLNLVVEETHILTEGLFLAILYAVCLGNTRFGLWLIIV